jgi:hypothetical protein
MGAGNMLLKFHQPFDFPKWTLESVTSLFRSVNQCLSRLQMNAFSVSGERHASPASDDKTGMHFKFHVSRARDRTWML